MNRTPEIVEAIGEFWKQGREGGIVTGWFLVMAGVDADGNKWLDWAWDEDLRTWELKGLVHEALDAQFSQAVAEDVITAGGDD